MDQFSNWKIQGNFDGEDYPDKTRKIFNEGGLFGEVNRWCQSFAALRYQNGQRMGYHLPGFDDSQWEEKTPFLGLDAPGVRYLPSGV